MSVDRNDYPWLSHYSWYLKNGYVARYCCIGRRASHDIYMHVEIMGADRRLHIHHINKDKLDNRRANLQALSPKRHRHAHPEIIAEFTRRIRDLPSRNKSGYKGVSWVALTGKWQCGIAVDGGNLYLGQWEDKEQAALIYDAAVLCYRDGEGYTNLLPFVP